MCKGRYVLSTWCPQFLEQKHDAHTGFQVTISLKEFWFVHKSRPMYHICDYALGRHFSPLKILGLIQ